MNKKDVLKVLNEIEAEKVKLAVSDIDGVLRGKVIHLEKFKSVLDGGFGFCDVVLGWDCNDLVYDNCDLTGWHTGYPDASASVDLSTLRQVPWDNNIPFLLADFTNVETGESLAPCPRNLLKTVKKRAEDQGLKAVFAQEFEWFNFSETPEELYAREFRSPRPMTKGMFGYSIIRSSQRSPYFNELFDLMSDFRVPIEGIHTETGPGVYEVAILYDDILEAADRAILFKTGAKEIGHRHGIMPTFMAKWSDDYPGCSGHLHQSLWKDGKNLFHDDKDPDGMSGTMRSYLAGLLKCLPELLPLFAPTVNSYKRLVEGAWAPTTLTWAIDNRTVAIRALPGGEKSSRLEFRVPGADCNPYLAMAGSLAAGLYGIENKLTLDVPKTIGNGYENKDNGVLPRNLWDATQKMKQSEIAREMFGDKFVDHFCATREFEWREFSKSITDWELKRYFEII